ncbi:MAG: C1 family peptidase [Candidatus Microthrix sp.]|nr:C1 family peptidase [Candidatus Microthrix sp.]
MTTITSRVCKSSGKHQTDQLERCLPGASSSRTTNRASLNNETGADMTIKEGTRLAETGILGDDLNIARALSLDTVDEFYDFITLFPADAASLFSSTDLADISRQIVPMSTVSMMAAHAHRGLTVSEMDHVIEEAFLSDPTISGPRTFGAVAPTIGFASQVTRLALEEVGVAPPGATSDEPQIRLSCLGPVRDQGSERSTCVAHTVCAMLECATGVADLSEQWLFWMCKLNDDLPKSDGTRQRVAVALALTEGVCDEVTWPYVAAAASSLSQGPPPESARAAAIANRATRGIVLDPRWVEGICEQLDEGRVVGISVPTYSTWKIAETSGDIPMPLPGQATDKGHSMAVVGYGFDDGYLGGGYLIVRNSWGTTWATGGRFGPGYGTIPFAYMREYGWEAYAIEGPAR